MSRKDRTFDRKKRGVEKRIRKPILLLQVEGKNKTEARYFSYFQSGNSKYSIQISKSGDTDPENMQNALRKKYEENDMNSDNGDLAFVVLDLDCKEKKRKTSVN